MAYAERASITTGALAGGALAGAISFSAPTTAGQARQRLQRAFIQASCTSSRGFPGDRVAANCANSVRVRWAHFIRSARPGYAITEQPQGGCPSPHRRTCAHKTGIGKLRYGGSIPCRAQRPHAPQYDLNISSAGCRLAWNWSGDRCAWGANTSDAGAWARKSLARPNRALQALVAAVLGLRVAISAWAIKASAAASGCRRGCFMGRDFRAGGFKTVACGARAGSCRRRGHA